MTDKAIKQKENAMQDILTDNLPEDVGDTIDDAVEEIKEIFTDAAAGLENTANIPDQLLEATEKFRITIKQILYFLSDYYLVIGIILVLICIIVAVFARKSVRGEEH